MKADILRGPLVLPDDLLIIPVAELPEEVRSKLGDGGEEFALARPRAREPSKLIDADAAHLLEHFREAKTIVRAVIAYSRQARTDPERTLEDSLPLLRQLVGSGLLLPEGAQQARPIEASLADGAAFGSFRIIRCIQVLDDSEIYQARDADGGFVALKIARRENDAAMEHRLDRESAALGRLAGTACPPLLANGSIDGRRFLALRWIPGIDAVSAAAELRQQGDRAGLLALLGRIALAYAELHRRGVLHGDIHPGNLLIGRDGAVSVVDLGLAQMIDAEPGPVMRGGVGFFMEPEYARATLAHRPPPPPTPAGEQFALAALLYMLATGRHYMEFTLEQEEMFRQIAEATPLPFAEVGAMPWPALETVLARALAREPAARHPDMAGFAEALAGAAPPAPAPVQRDGLEGFLAAMLEDIGLDGTLFRQGLPQAPFCSVNFGAGGIAYGLYRLAGRRDDARLLAAAEAWIMMAARDADGERAFANPEMDLSETTVGRISPYHARPGLPLVQAMIAEAAGEEALRDAAANAYLAAIEQPCAERDLTLGRAGAVLGSALLLELLPASGHPLAERLIGSAERRLDELWAETEPLGSLARASGWPNLGIAHGWAGLLYVTLRWHGLTGRPMPETFRRRLAELIDMARPAGRGLAWPWRQSVEDGTQATMPGWCNGAAGMVHLACLGHRLLGEESLLKAAKGAAWQAWEAGEGPVDLCCGYAGRAYALLEFHRSTGEPAWLARARDLARRAVNAAAQQRSAEHPRHSLYKGELGLALLIADLDRPADAAMPLFASEGWR